MADLLSFSTFAVPSTILFYVVMRRTADVYGLSILASFVNQLTLSI